MCTRSCWCSPMGQALVVLLMAAVVWVLYPHPNSELIRAIQSGDERRMVEIIEHQISSKTMKYRHVFTADDIRLGYDRTPLAVAAKYCQPRLVDVLLKRYNSNPNLRNSVDEGTVLFTSAGYDTSGECVRLLLSHPNVDIEAMSKSDWTPLYNAIMFSNAIAVAHLLRAGANPHHSIEVMNMGRINALHFALTHSTPEVARMLIDRGAYLTNSGPSAQHYVKFTAIRDMPWDSIKRTPGIDWSAEDVTADGAFGLNSFKV